MSKETFWISVPSAMNEVDASGVLRKLREQGIKVEGYLRIKTVYYKCTGEKEVARQIINRYDKFGHYKFLKNRPDVNKFDRRYSM
jgi:hypothetical protein